MPHFKKGDILIAPKTETTYRVDWQNGDVVCLTCEYTQNQSYHVPKSMTVSADTLAGWEKVKGQDDRDATDQKDHRTPT